jgi:hypothetical protein
MRYVHHHHHHSSSINVQMMALEILMKDVYNRSSKDSSKWKVRMVECFYSSTKPTFNLSPYIPQQESCDQTPSTNS